METQFQPLKNSYITDMGDGTRLILGVNITPKETLYTIWKEFPDRYNMLFTFNEKDARTIVQILPQLLQLKKEN
jgi:hypothetical protein